MYILNAIQQITKVYNFSNRLQKHNSRYVLETLSIMAATKEHRLLDTPWVILHVQMALCEKFWRCMTWNIFTDLGPSSSQPGHNKNSHVLHKLTWFNPYTRCAHNALFASFLPPNRFFCFDPRANAVSACPHKRFFSFFFLLEYYMPLVAEI